MGPNKLRHLELLNVVLSAELEGKWLLSEGDPASERMVLKERERERERGRGVCVWGDG